MAAHHERVFSAARLVAGGNMDDWGNAVLHPDGDFGAVSG